MGSSPPVDFMPPSVSSNRKKVAYFYDSDIGNFAYGSLHPMKPHRIRLAHSLVMNYDLYTKMEIFRAKPATKNEMTQFHSDEYIEFLSKINPDNADALPKEQQKFSVLDDCPAFDGLFDFCGISAGGSMEGAARLNRGKCDIAINWAGGLHHAKKNEASGFCYVNDIVLGIIELLRFKQRVLYIDIDVHHGDGVEEAFYTTDRVMTCSFHKYGEFFPGTGELRDIGVGQGKNYAVNFPLRDGIDDASYKDIFEPVISAVMQYYRPEAVVLQCGGDSLSGDRLGCFNLSMRGHANCVKFVKSFNIPTMILGGGGYTMRNVARTWAFETGVLVGQEDKMSQALPYNEYYEYYGPDYELDVRPSNTTNHNTPEYLQKIKIQVIENLKKTAHVPSVQMQDVPRETLATTEAEDKELDDLDEDENPDVRMTKRRWEQRTTQDTELYESEDEEQNREHGIKKQPQKKRKRNIMDDFKGTTDPDVAMTDSDQAPQMPALTGENKTAAIAEANAEIGADLMKRKALGLGVAAEGEAGPSNAASRDESPDRVMTDFGAEPGSKKLDFVGHVQQQQLGDGAAPKQAPKASAPAPAPAPATKSSPPETRRADETAKTAIPPGRLTPPLPETEEEAFEELVKEAEEEAEIEVAIDLEAQNASFEEMMDIEREKKDGEHVQAERDTELAKESQA